MQDLLAYGQTLYDRWFNSPFEGAVIPFGAEVKFFPMSLKDSGRVHQFGAKVLTGRFMGCALNVGEVWTGDPLILDTEDFKTMPPSEIHVKSFIKSKDVELLKRSSAFAFPCRTTAVLHRCVQSGRRPEARQDF